MSRCMDMNKVLNKLVDTCFINEIWLSLGDACLVNSIIYLLIFIYIIIFLVLYSLALH